MGSARDKVFLVGFMAAGKTRPLEPTMVGWPSPAAQSRSAAGGKASMAGARNPAAVP